MVKEHHPLSGHKFEQTQGDSELEDRTGWWSLVCFSPRGGHDLVTEQQQQQQQTQHKARIPSAWIESDLCRLWRRQWQPTPELLPGLRRFPWRRESLPTPVFWPGEFHELYSP